jgi:signal transduction histidine kinase
MPETDGETLERMVEERTRELSTLLDVSRTVASTLELEPLLSHVLDALQQFVGYDGISVSVIDGEDLLIVVGRPGLGEERPLTRRTPFAQRSPIWKLIAEGGPQIIDDVQGDGRLAQTYRQAAAEAGYPDVSGFRSWMGVPLTLKGQVIGALSIVNQEPDAFTAHHAALVSGVTQQVAIAVENARLYQRAQEAAVLEERQRISRELHDSVSQALYSIALGARTARELVDREPESLAEPLDFVLAQAERGLAEMRALIFELRPEALEQEGLTSALQKQADALQARYQLAVDVSLAREPDVPLRVKEALYRIAQEALQNVVKHAGATRVDLSLSRSDEGLMLEVRDNGRGFDASGSFPGHLGLQSMHERAARVGGLLEIVGAAGVGTTLQVSVPSRGADAKSSP